MGFDIEKQKKKEKKKVEKNVVGRERKKWQIKPRWFVGIWYQLLTTEHICIPKITDKSEKIEGKKRYYRGH